MAASLFPKKAEHGAFWELYKRMQSSFWVVEEVPVREDRAEFEALPEDARNFITMVLAFFAKADNTVIENLSKHFIQDVQDNMPSVPMLPLVYSFQAAIEAVHAEMYGQLIDVYIRDTDLKDRVFRAAETMPIIAKKEGWARTWMDSDAPFAARLVAFACVEGISFAGAFCAIYYMKDRYKGKLQALTYSNELIARDELQHRDFAALIYESFPHKLPQDTVHGIVRSCVDLETEFVREAVPVRMIGMSADAMVQYIQFIADDLCKRLGAAPVYGAKNPFDFMERLNLENRTNFFERRVSEYAKSAVQGDVNKVTFNTSGEADF
jgi:ribonucleotide reductase beta subunit family protein with ferritin-like domain